METYRFQCVREGKVVATQFQDLPDDFCAIDAARDLAALFEIEVSCGERYVARVRPGDAPPKTTDRYGG
jgi:hypothetical protein